MSLPVPVRVRLKTAKADRHVGHQVRSLEWSTSSPGGFDHATIGLDRPLVVDSPEIAYYGELEISDARNGSILFQGRQEDPGSGVSGDGQVWDISALGPSAHVNDRTAQLIYMDRSLERWERSWISDKTAQIDQTDHSSSGDEALLFKAPEGTTVGTGWQADYQYRAIYDAGMKLARVRCDVVNGGTSTLWENRILSRPAPGGAGQTNDSNTWSTSSQSLACSRGGSPSIPSGDDVANLRITRVGSSGTATASSWGDFFGIAVRGLLKDKDGSDITSGYSSSTVFGSSVVKDLLGRLLDEYDGANATVEDTAFGLEQLAYPDPVKPGQVLEDLITMDEAFTWHAWEKTTIGKHRFEWIAWPATVRYDATVADGAHFPGSADGLYNECAVRWRDSRGRIKVTVRTSSVQALTDAGLTRTASLDLSDEVGVTTGQAQRRGDQFLAEHAVPPNAGTLTIMRPILDRVKGRMVMPWEIRAGALIRVRGVKPNVDSLNATARDGTTVFRLARTTCRIDSEVRTVCELDAPTLSEARALARLKRRRQRRR